MTCEYPVWAWGAFAIVVVAMLALDLGVFNRKAHVVPLRKAVAWCVVWFALAMGFNAFVWHEHGARAGAQWLASYLVELGLSVDNVFVFLVVFSYFKVSAEHQRRVLLWGIVGAALMRAVFILAGLRLIGRFEWVLMVFGAFLIFTGARLALPGKGRGVQPGKNIVMRLFRGIFPMSPEYAGGNFFTRIDGRLVATPLFFVLLVIETTDVMFAIDSIPAVLGITKAPFIALTSNIFAVLGLRSLYFAVSGAMGRFRFLNYGLAVILVFIGVKMLVEDWYRAGMGLSLGVIGGTLAAAVLASALFPEKKAGE